jgi:hypothetical protein
MAMREKRVIRSGSLAAIQTSHQFGIAAFRGGVGHITQRAVAGLDPRDQIGFVLGGETAIIDPGILFGVLLDGGEPRRHGAFTHDALDDFGAVFDLSEVVEREGRDAAIAMTGDAVLLKDAGDIAVVGDGRCGDLWRITKVQLATRRGGGLDEGLFVLQMSADGIVQVSMLRRIEVVVDAKLVIEGSAIPSAFESTRLNHCAPADASRVILPSAFTSNCCTIASIWVTAGDGGVAVPGVAVGDVLPLT